MKLTLRRYLQLLIGLAGCGFGVAGIITSNLGAAPWDVLTQGISNHSSLTFGTITIITGAVVLLLWIPLRQRPGVGTILNAIFIGVFADFGLALYPASEEFWIRLIMLTLGLCVLGGTVGIGTIAVALLIGPLCQVFLRIFMIPRTVPKASAL